MKLLTLTLLSAFFLIGSVSVSYAHCGMCGEADNHAEMKKPCEKCMKAGKKCGCGDKDKPCHKMKKMDGDKPCMKCAESERKWHMKKKEGKKWNNLNEKGTLHIRKYKPLDDRYND